MQRHQQVARLRTEPFDLLVIGGGSTGTAIALDAAARGLRAALVERGDFAFGTSSRSTKLIHGGVRYLEQAVRGLDRSQLTLVRHALDERATLLRIAPHLTHPLPLATPVYSLWERLYLQAGLTLYDRLAGSRAIGATRFMPRAEAVSRFPELRDRSLRGAILYYDGQFDDARMCVTLALTAHREGAALANYLEVTGLSKTANRVRGAQVLDRVSGERFAIHARAVVNATGPYADAIRALDEPGPEPLLRVSAGVHLVFDDVLGSGETGLLIPKTDDGRILFILPWQGKTLVGTTDEPATVEADPRPAEGQIAYLLRHVNRYLRKPLDRSDVRAAWSGLRPLVAAGGSRPTAALARDHVIVESSSGLVTVTGGKWTTYRLIAADAVDHVVASAGLAPTCGCRTAELPLVGAREYRPDGWERLAAAFGIEREVAQHLHRAYGDRAAGVAEIAAAGYGAPLAPGFPYVEAEVVWAAREEMALNAGDVLARRTRLAFLDTAAAERAKARVDELMQLALQA
ncbi:MAG TPA: FAD-dependent oxidoreductase [Candidatus Dormibacteraeota bacterium]|nr:FAD-dependent oxidoreductase [Candidatus Dormibacteraeota bacterium]